MACTVSCEGRKKQATDSDSAIKRPIAPQTKRSCRPRRSEQQAQRQADGARTGTRLPSSDKLGNLTDPGCTVRRS